MRMIRFGLRACAGLALVGASIVVASPAAAHITIDPETAEAGEFTVLTFSVPHGCDGSATTELVFQMPESVPEVTPTVNPGWDIDKTTEKLDEPIEVDGAKHTKRDSKVTYTAKTPLPDDQRDTIELSMKLPDQAGDDLEFPVVQKCEEGQTEWTDTSADGQAEPDEPAPVVTLTAADDDESSSAPATTAVADDTTQSVAIIGLIVAIVALIAAVSALITARRQSR